MLEDADSMKGVPAPPTPLTEHTQQFVELVKARARAEGRNTASRADWLLTLLSVGHPYRSSYIIGEINLDRAELDSATRAAEHEDDPWLAELVPDFLSAEAEPIAREIGHTYIGTEHILLVFTRSPGRLGDRLRNGGLRWDAIRAAFDAIEWVRPSEGG